jgi:hypothetical protein
MIKHQEFVYNTNLFFDSPIATFLAPRQERIAVLLLPLPITRRSFSSLPRDPSVFVLGLHGGGGQNRDNARRFIRNETSKLMREVTLRRLPYELIKSIEGGRILSLQKRRGETVVMHSRDEANEQRQRSTPSTTIYRTCCFHFCHFSSLRTFGSCK